MTDNDRLFSEYFKSIYSQSNTFSAEEYENSYNHYELNYGKYLPAKMDARILEIGCGGGHFLYYLKKKGYNNFLGIDLSDEAVELCRDRITFYVEKADAFSFLTNQANLYDAIFSSDMIEHIQKDKILVFLTLVYKALKPNGVLLLRLPNMGNPFALNNRYRDFSHECGYTEKSIFQVLYLSGFRAILIKPDQLYGKPINVCVSRIISALLYVIIRKLFWYQGFTSPEILSSRMVIIAGK
jgi:cyclopropane fatty-acyl-phospholipid synthase-like methyltransferase